jgi:hypothetical protein
MRELPGGLLFVAAAVYMAITKTPDVITLIAVSACAAIAALSGTRHTLWSIIGGAMLIAGSLLFQSVMSYRCFDCLKADFIILAGIIYLSVVSKEFKGLQRALSMGMMVLMAATIAVNTGPATAENEKPAQSEELSRYVTAYCDDRQVSLDTAARAVLFYSPTCGPCQNTVQSLIQTDPQGKYWVPVQTSGEASKGEEYLTQKGYRGIILSSEWNGPVPTMVVTQGGQTIKLSNPEEMLRLVGGDID